MTAVSLQTEPVLDVVRREQLFPDPFWRSPASQRPEYDILADGRFLMVEAGPPGYQKLSAYVDWVPGMETRLGLPR